MTRALDAADWRILDELQRDGRASLNEIARRISMSAPAVAERVRRLEDSGVIAGYRAVVRPERVGLPLSAFVQLRCETGHCLLKTTRAEEFPEVEEIHKLTGSSCTMLKIRASSMHHLESVLEQLGHHRNLESHVVLSTQFERTTVDRPSDDPRFTSDSPGWRRESNIDGSQG